MSTPNQQNDLSDESTAALITRATQQVSELVRDELRLAQAEMADKGKRLVRGGGLFGAAGIAVFLGVEALLAAAIAGLATALPVWAAALIVAGTLLVVAGVFALTARRQIKRAVPLLPDQAISSVKADVAEIKKEAHR